MWLYEKKLEYPVKIKRPNPALAKFIISQVGGPDGEMGAATRYLQQRYSMPYAQVKGMLTDIGTEELAHIEMVSAIIYQLTRCMTPEEIKRSGFDTYFVDHTAGVYPQAASGYPFSTSELQVSGDTLADLYEDLAAEQKARKTYDNILRLADDPDVRDPIKFLREREVVHFQRFGDALRITQENLDAKNFYAFNPSFDKKCNPPQKLFSPPCTPDAVAAPACGCAQQAQPCQPCQPCAQPRSCAPVNNACGCGCAVPAAEPACGCANAVPDTVCGCAAVVTETTCGCAAAADPACGCAAAMPEKPACGCVETPPVYSSFVPNPIGMNSCCCAPQPAPYAKRNKRGGCGCG